MNVCFIPLQRIDQAHDEHQTPTSSMNLAASSMYSTQSSQRLQIYRESKGVPPSFPATLSTSNDFCTTKPCIRSRRRLGRKGILNTDVMHLEVPCIQRLVHRHRKDIGQSALHRDDIPVSSCKCLSVVRLWGIA